MPDCCLEHVYQTRLLLLGPAGGDVGLIAMRAATAALSARRRVVHVGCHRGGALLSRSGSASAAVPVVHCPTGAVNGSKLGSRVAIGSTLRIVTSGSAWKPAASSNRLNAASRSRVVLTGDVSAARYLRRRATTRSSSLSPGRELARSSIIDTLASAIRHAASSSGERPSLTRASWAG